MRSIEELSHGEALWELLHLPPDDPRREVLSTAATRATGLLALAFRGASHEEIARYAREIPEPAGRLARRWARDDWGYWRRRPSRDADAEADAASGSGDA